MKFPQPAGKPTFTAPWFKWFLPNLTLPEGGQMRWEGHTLLMTDEFFRPDLVHLLVLIPKSNQKTTWEAALAVWHLLTVAAPRAYCGAADKEQATELYDFAAHFASDADLAPWLSVRPSTKEIRHTTAPGRSAFKVLASDDSKQGGKKQGKNLTLAEGDELHAWENRNLFVDLRSGGFKRRDAARIDGDPLWWTLGKMATITTEGFDSESVLAEELAKFLGDPEKGLLPKGTVESGLRVLPDGSVEKHPDGRLTIARYGAEDFTHEVTGETFRNGGNVLLRWACDPDDDTSNDAVVKLANPASTASVSSIADARAALTPWEFLRYRCNIRTLAFKSWLPDGSWSDLADPRVPVVTHRTWEGATTTGELDEQDNPLLEDITDESGAIVKAALTDEFRAFVDSLYPKGTAIVGAIDMGRYRDTAAIVLLGAGPDGRTLPRAIVWRTGSQDEPIKYEWTKAAWLRIKARYELRAAAYDPKYYDQSAEELTGKGVPMEATPQSNERMCPAAADLRTAIITDKSFIHDGDPILEAHLMAAVTKDVGAGQFKLVKSKDSGPPIDACVALAMAKALPPPATWAVIF